MKLATDIVKYGRVKAYFNKKYSFNTIDIETINNELFLIGVIQNDEYIYTLKGFYAFLNNLLIDSVQHNKDILSWSRYDNTFIIKTLIENFSDDEKRSILERIDKVTPLFEYEYNGFTIEVTNIIKENIIFTIYDCENKKKVITIYNLKNLCDSDLETTAKDYHIDYYSKMGEEFHIIDLNRFKTDSVYRKGVIKSNELDNRVLLDIADQLLHNFEIIAGVLPKTMFTAGSLARSYLLTLKDINFNFKSLMGKSKIYDKILDYSMKAYHGGKIESYIIGHLDHAKIIDISSAYPYAISILPKITHKATLESDLTKLDKYYYAFINCRLWGVPDALIHPISVESPINVANISPSGDFEAIITKIEYDYMIAHGVKIEVIDFVGIESTNETPYKDMIQQLFDKRMETKSTNKSLSGLYKLILNSLYGITFELGDQYQEDELGINWLGYRAGDFFNPIIASYITAITRTYLSEVSNHIIENGGEVYLNMTDSIIYKGDIKLDIFSEVKTLGKFEPAKDIHDIIILGAGRYEYQDEYNKWIIKSRGFKANVKDKSFYKDLDLTGNIEIEHRTFISFFKAITEKYNMSMLGHLVDDEYIINPLNLGGKRIIENLEVDLKTGYTKTRPVRL